MIEIDKMLKKITRVRPKLDECGNTRLGLRVPEVRAFVKHNFSYVETDSKTQINYWDNVWRNSNYFESRSAALYFYQHRSLLLPEIRRIKNWVNECNCWEHSDDLSKIYSLVVEEKPSEMLQILKSWNESSNPWKRRQSVVGLIEYSSKRNSILPYKKLIEFIMPLMSDEDYYVQKGLGWTMREIYNVYPKQMMKFFNQNLHLINPTAYSAAVEKLDKKTKEHFRMTRKHKRQSA